MERASRPPKAVVDGPRLSLRGTLVCAALLLLVGSACITTEYGLTITAPDLDGESELIATISERLHAEYVDAAMQANGEYRADLAAVGGTVSEDPFPTTIEGLSDLMSSIPTAQEMRDDGMDVDESYDGFVATRTIALSEALADQESSEEKMIVVDESAPPAIRYIFDQVVPIGDAENDLVAQLEEIDRYRREGLPPKPKLVIREGEIVAEGEVDYLALFGSLGEKSELEAWYWFRILVETGIPTFSFSVSMPGEVVLYTIDGVPGGNLVDNRVTFVFDEAFMRRLGTGDHRLHVETVYIPGQTPASHDDRDGDGIPDDDDACPNQYGPPPDGCPTDALALACVPADPAAYAQVTCTARVPEAYRTDALTFDWYLDGAHQGTSTQPTWVWGSAEPGKHDVDVDAIGDGWSSSASIPLDVSEDRDLVATLGYAPDPPVADKSLILSVQVDGSRPDETLTYRWFLDDQLASEAETMAWVAITGTHTVQVEVRGEGDRLAVDRRSVAVPPLQPAFYEATPGAQAAFDISYLQCTESITTGETVECTVGITRDDSKVGALGVVWFVDGALAQQEESVSLRSAFALENPSPGQHTIQVRVIDPESGDAAARSAVVRVEEGAGGRIPTAAAAGAAAGTAGTIGAWLWLEWWRARMGQQRVEAAARAAEARKTAEEAADEALRQDRQRWYDQVEELNRVERQQRAYREALGEYYDAALDHLNAVIKLGHLERDHAQLSKRLAELKVQFDVARLTAVTDGVLEIADMMVDTLLWNAGGGPEWLSTVPGGYGKDWLKALLKAAARQKVREAHGVRRYEPDFLRKQFIDPAGIPSDYFVDPDAAMRDKGLPRIIFDLGLPRGISKTLLSQGLEKRFPADDLGKGLGFSYSVFETGATAAADTADKMEECRKLRRQMSTTLDQVLRRERAIPDAQDDAAQATRVLQQRTQQVAAAQPSAADRAVNTQARWEAMQQR